MENKRGSKLTFTQNIEKSSKKREVISRSGEKAEKSVVYKRKNLDHGFPKDEGQGLPLESGGEVASRNDANNTGARSRSEESSSG